MIQTLPYAPKPRVQFDDDIAGAIGKQVRLTRTGTKVELWAQGTLTYHGNAYEVSFVNGPARVKINFTVESVHDVFTNCHGEVDIVLK
jgi:hypothetical protein